MFADLHLHTYFSDGTYTPEELAAHAKDKGLSAIALTDHDTVEGAERASAACEACGIEFITGTELTADQDNYELHILPCHNPDGLGPEVTDEELQDPKTIAAIEAAIRND